MHDEGRRDASLLALARSGDSAAFEALVKRHGRAAFAVAYSILQNPSDAEDICQDAWVRVLERLEDCREPEHFVGWMLQVVRNRALNQLAYRRRRATDELEAAFGPEGPPGREDPARDHRREVLRERLEWATARLPDAYREVLLLHDLAGLGHHDIALHLGITENLSRQRLFQARSRMRQLLDGTRPAEER